MSLIIGAIRPKLQALRFGAATSDRVRYGVLPGETAATTALPRTVLMWVRISTITASRRFWTWGVTSPIYRCQINTTAGEVQIQTARSTSANLRVSTGGLWVANRWLFFAATIIDDVATANAIHMFYGDPNKPATEATYSTTTDGVGTIAAQTNAVWTLGNDAAAAPTVALQGDVAFFGVYGRVLSLNDIREMQFDPTAQGDCRIFSVPGWNGRGAVINYAAHYRAQGTITGATPIADQPPLAPPWRLQRRLWVKGPAAAGGVTGTSAQALPLGGSAAAAVTVAGASAVALPLGAAAAAAVAVAGASSQALPLAGSAVGAVTVAASSSAALPLGGTATGTVVTPGINVASTLALPLAGTAAAAVAVAASSTRALPLSGTAAATVAVTAASSSPLPLAGSAAATVSVSAASTQALPLGGSAAGAVAVVAASTRALPLAGSATGVVGSVPVSADSLRALPLAGSATATVTVVGSSTRALPLGGAAAATALVAGASVQALPLGGAATATVLVTGASTLRLPLAGSAAGTGGGAVVDYARLAGQLRAGPRVLGTFTFRARVARRALTVRPRLDAVVRINGVPVMVNQSQPVRAGASNLLELSQLRDVLAAAGTYLETADVHVTITAVIGGAVVLPDTVMPAVGDGTGTYRVTLAASLPFQVGNSYRASVHGTAGALGYREDAILVGVTA
jgi:hypothetical protein